MTSDYIMTKHYYIIIKNWLHNDEEPTSNYT